MHQRRICVLHGRDDSSARVEPGGQAPTADTAGARRQPLRRRPSPTAKTETKRSRTSGRTPGRAATASASPSAGTRPSPTPTQMPGETTTRYSTSSRSRKPGVRRRVIEEVVRADEDGQHPVHHVGAQERGHPLRERMPARRRLPRTGRADVRQHAGPAGDGRGHLLDRLAAGVRARQGAIVGNPVDDGRHGEEGDRSRPGPARRAGSAVRAARPAHTVGPGRRAPARERRSRTAVAHPSPRG